MTYAVLADHPEALDDGRLVESGEHISDSDAQKNPRLIERGVLVKEETERPPKPRHKKEPERKPEPETAVAPQEEESK